MLNKTNKSAIVDSKMPIVFYLVKRQIISNPLKSLGRIFAYNHMGSGKMLNRLNMKLVKSLFSFVLMLSSCSKVKFEDTLAGRILKSSSGGDIYGGKIFVKRLDQSICNDGTDIKTVVIRNFNGEYSLAKENCMTINPPIAIDQSEIIVHDASKIGFRDEILTEDFIAPKDDSSNGLPPEMITPKSAVDYCYATLDQPATDSAPGALVKFELMLNDTGITTVRASWFEYGGDADSYSATENLKVNLDYDDATVSKFSGTDNFAANGPMSINVVVSKDPTQSIFKNNVTIDVGGRSIDLKPTCTFK